MATTFEDVGITVKNGSERFTTTCPQCSDKRKAANKRIPCLTVWNSADNKGWNCNHCGWTGSLQDHEKYEKLYTNSKAPVRWDFDYSYYPKEIIDYFKSRGINPDTLKSNKVFYTSNAGNLAIAFPAYKSGRLVNAKYRALKMKRFWQMKEEEGAKPEKCFIGLDAVDFEHDGRLIIVEGEIDWLTLKQLKINNTISVPEGAPAPDSTEFGKKFDFLNDKYTQDILARATEIILCVDDDEAGKVLRDELAKRLGKQRCKIVDYPMGYKDINEVFIGSETKKLEALGGDAVLDWVGRARFYPVKGLVRVSDIDDDLVNIRKKGLEPGLKCGVKEIDRIITFKRKLLYVITGVPGSGKSTWLRYWATQLTKNNPKEHLRWAIYSPESARPLSREATRYMEVFAEKGIAGDGEEENMSEQQYDKAKQWVNEHYIFIIPTRNNFEEKIGGKDITKDRVNALESILEYAKVAIKQYGVSALVIDPWNKVEHAMEKYETETLYISRVLDILIDFGDQYDIAIIIVAHPTKVKKRLSGNYEMVSLYSISGSANWFNKADVGVVVHRNKYRKTESQDDQGQDIYEFDKYAATHVITEKIRFEETGNEGNCQMYMDLQSGSTFRTKSLLKKKKKEQKTMDLDDSAVLADTSSNNDDEDDIQPF
jgi:twinkle protein